jgi:hypothetical protein
MEVDQKNSMESLKKLEVRKKVVTLLNKLPEDIQESIVDVLIKVFIIIDNTFNDLLLTKILKLKEEDLGEIFDFFI